VTRRARRRRGPAAGAAGGFTLIEVLVALGILATSLVVLLENVSSSIRLSAISRDLTVAAMIARDKMTEIELDGKYVIGNEEGDFEDRYPGFWWTTAVQEGLFPGVLQVDLTIFWGEKDAPEHLTVSSFAQATEDSYSGTDSEETTGDDTGGSSSGTGGDGT
jgi:general secretion pathway protein I